MASMFGAWVLLSPGETGANFGIVSLVGYAVGIAGIAVGVVVVAYTSFGGLRASIYTDRNQLRVLMPAMLLLRRASAAGLRWWVMNTISPGCHRRRG